MGSIKPLPETVCSSVRSGFIISDLVKVVEELAYNSLDAGATKVLVAIGVNTGYVKVDDNGCGINRDGLALLGERYATSKHHKLPDTSSESRCLGNRGEVLCSIADVSLLEIITKAQGRPNGYRKIMKGSKCLYLGIDADRRDVGTSVIVRDIFYNQPVRRTHMQTSLKKVLHSVMKCVLRIALVRPEVSFSVIDIESEDELLCTHASSSPLSILSNHFGIEVSTLHELSLSEGSFELTGYVSASADYFSTKAIQYIYINSRFIDKGPIHKLLNRLASTCLEQLDSYKFGKRSRPQACATYCLNLTCPESFYDLHLEQMKTSAEFKDLLPVLSLIEKSVASLWNSRASNGELISSPVDLTSKHHMRNEAGLLKSAKKDAVFLDTYEVPKKRCRIQGNHAQHISLNRLLFPLGVETREIGQSSDHQDNEAVTMPSMRNTKIISESKLEDDLYGMHPFRPYNHSDPRCSFPARDCRFNHPWDISDNLISLNEDVSENISFTERHDSSLKNFFSSREMAESPTKIIANLELNKAEISPEIVLPFQFEDDKKLFVHEKMLFNNKERFSFDTDHLGTDGEYTDYCGKQLADNNGELIPVQEDFKENLSSIRKYNFWGDHVCSLGIDEPTRMVVAGPGSNEADPSLGNYVPSQFEDGRSQFLQNHYSLRKTNEMLFSGKKWLDFKHEQGDESGYIGSGGRADDMKFHSLNKNVDEFQSTRWQGDAFSPDPFLGSEAESAGCKDSLFLDQECAAAEHDRCHAVQQAGGFDGNFQTSASEHKPITSASIFSVNSWDFDHHSLEAHGWNSGSTNLASSKHFKDKINDFHSHDLDDRFNYKDFSYTSYSNSHLRNRCEGDNDDICGSFPFWHHISSTSSARKGDTVNTETDLTFEETDEDFTLSSSVFHNPSIFFDKAPKIHLRRCGISQREIAKVRRSNSAPPIYRGKRKFVPLNSSSATVVANSDGWILAVSCEDKQEKRTRHSSTQPDQFHGTNPTEGFPLRNGQKMKEAANMTDVANSQDGKKLEGSGLFNDTESLEAKWQNVCPQAGCDYLHDFKMIREKSLNSQDYCTILDISSGILHLVSDTIIPKSINRICLEKSEVLSQIDKKFIPVVAGKTLAVIDQHAADERIRLEELRREVLSGKMKTITHLEEEKEMILPETAYQLLHNYANQVRNWGWICNIYEDSQSFTKNLSLLNRQPSVIKLLAVPCILGVNLSDTDLLDYIEQLADTDGSSNIPPSVLRVLNNKACRGAIMFGDTLLPSECALIVEELKKTSLCFQCAHGRPTMAPLVNLEALRKQIEKLGLCNVASNKPWHGLRRQEISLERAKQRLGMG